VCDPRDKKSFLTGECLTSSSSDVSVKLVLKCGTKPFLGGLTSRPLFFFCRSFRTNCHA
jgi:hypothetical protein